MLPVPQKTRPYLLLATLLLFAAVVSAQTTHYPPDGDQIPGPDCLAPVRPNLGQPKICSPEDYKAWLDDITHWRMEATDSRRLFRAGI